MTRGYYRKLVVGDVHYELHPEGSLGRVKVYKMKHGSLRRVKNPMEIQAVVHEASKRTQARQDRLERISLLGMKEEE